MKNILTVSVLSLGLLFGGCTTKESSISLDLEMKTCSKVIQGLQFDYPSDWKECGTHNDGIIYFVKEAQGTQVALELQTEKITTLPSNSGKSRELHHPGYTLSLYNLIHGYYPLALSINDEVFYKLLWSATESKETFKDVDLKGFFTEQEKDAILKSVRKTDKAYHPNEPNTGKSTENLKSCDKSYLGLSFEYPKNWGECKLKDADNLSSSKKIWFKKYFNGNDLWLAMNIREFTQEEALGDHRDLFSGGQGECQQFNNSTICEVMAGYALTFDDVSYYTVGFNPVAGAKHSEFISDTHHPYNDFSQEDMLNIVKSVKRAK